jgi:hypothetical protein
VHLTRGTCDVGWAMWMAYRLIPYETLVTFSGCRAILYDSRVQMLQKSVHELLDYSGMPPRDQVSIHSYVGQLIPLIHQLAPSIDHVTGNIVGTGYLAAHQQGRIGAIQPQAVTDGTNPQVGLNYCLAQKLDSRGLTGFTGLHSSLIAQPIHGISANQDNASKITRVAMGYFVGHPYLVGYMAVVRVGMKSQVRLIPEVREVDHLVAMLGKKLVEALKFMAIEVLFDHYPDPAPDGLAYRTFREVELAHEAPPTSESRLGEANTSRKKVSCSLLK